MVILRSDSSSFERSYFYSVRFVWGTVLLLVVVIIRYGRDLLVGKGTKRLGEFPVERGEVGKVGNRKVDSNYLTK